MKKILLIAIAVMCVSVTATAGEYKSAGCGLGSMLIKSDGFLQIFAVTTNASFYSQTFGITSGTSNCGGSGGYAKADVEKQMYVHANYDALTQEMAQGSGEHLNALAAIMGCEKGANGEFAGVMKKNYGSVASKDADGMLDSVKSTISSDPVLLKSCSG